MSTLRTHSTPARPPATSSHARRTRRSRVLSAAGAVLVAGLALAPVGPAGAAPVGDAVVPAIVTGVADADAWAGSDEAQQAAADLAAENASVAAFLQSIAAQQVAEYLAVSSFLDHQATLARVGPVLDEARAKLGRPYSYGASGPNAFDCSGFTRWVWQRAGVELPHYSGAQWAQVQKIPVEELAPGDLVFYWGRGGGDPSHVALYVGDGQIVHAPGRGRSVRYDSVWYWEGARVAAGRVG